MDSSAPRYPQALGYLIGGILLITIVIWVLLPGQNEIVLGPMNTGHEELVCQDCHLPAQGTTRQQIQANTRFYLGLRETKVDFGHEEIGNATCQACHERPNDAHPTFRFLEPRFAEARQAIQPETCIACHQEHQGKRVTIDPIFCVHCHASLEVQNDPISWSHVELIANERWETCLGCHDFHGNHVMELETIVSKALQETEIEDYFNGGNSPYSDTTFFQANESLDE